MSAPAADKLRVGIFVHSLNHNNMGRVYPFLQAHVHSQRVHLTLIGWDSTGKLFPLLKELPWPIVRLPGNANDPQARQALDAVVASCNILHCFKNHEHLRLGLEIARAHGVPLLLDLDDWELGLYLEGVAKWPRWRQVLWGYPMIQRLKRFQRLEELARTAPAALLVNSRALQGHFGGEIVYTAADATAFGETGVDGARFRERYGLARDSAVIGFLGTPHAHKGIDELLAAFELVRPHHPSAQLLFVGVPEHNAYHRRLRELPGVVVVDYVDAAAYPQAYAACDVVTIPQRAVTEGIMQTPAKLILGMAAGRAIVATTVGDIPAILGDAGVLVSPQDPIALGTAIDELLNAPERRRMLGSAARLRFQQGFTLEHLEQQMYGLYRALVSAR